MGAGAPGERCVLVPALGKAHWCSTHSAPWAESEDCRCQCQYRLQQPRVKVSAAAERAVGDLLIALFPTVHVTGKGLPLGSESGFGVPPWWQWCLRWGHAWITEAGGGVCAHKETEACVLVRGMWAHVEEPAPGMCMSPGRLAAAVALGYYLGGRRCQLSLQRRLLGFTPANTTESSSVQAARIPHCWAAAESSVTTAVSLLYRARCWWPQWYPPCGLRWRPSPFVVLGHFWVSQLNSISSVILPVQLFSTFSYTVLLQVLIWVLYFPRASLTCW